MRLRFDALAPWVVGLMVALPVVLVRYPPMGDLPRHEAVVAVLRHFDDATRFPAGLYAHNFGHPNQLFYLVAWLLSYVTTVTLACKLVAAGAIALMAPAAARLARYLDRPGWVGVLALPPMFGWLFVWGVVQNMIGLALLAALLPTIDRAAAARTWRASATLLGALVALYAAHEEMLAVGCAFVVVHASLRPRPAIDLAPLLAPVAAIVALAAAQLVAQEPLRLPENLARPFELGSLPHRIAIAPAMPFPGQTAGIRALGWATILAPVIALAVLARRDRRTRAPQADASPASSSASRVYDARFAILAGLAGLAYLALPTDALGAHRIYHRFWPVAFVLGVVLVAPPSRVASRPSVVLLALLAPLASLFIAAPNLLESDRRYRDYDALLARVEPGSALMNLDLAPPATELVRSVGTQGHAVAVRGGRSPFDYTHSPIAPAILARPAAWSESTGRLLGFAGFRPAWDLQRYRYVFVYAEAPEWRAIAPRAMAPEGRLIGERGDWMLFESTFPRASLLEPDAPLPDPPPPSFLDRAAVRAPPIR